MDNKAIGKWALIIGALIAIITAFLAADNSVMKYIPIILLILGAIVGLLVVEEKNAVKLMIAIILFGSALGAGAFIITALNDSLGKLELLGIVSNLATLLAGTGIIVTVKAILDATIM